MSAPTFFDGPINIPVPINSLTSVGLQAETVKQLNDMKQYLAVNFGLDMSISAIPGLLAHSILHQGRGGNGSSGSSSSGNGYDNNSGKYRPNPDDIQFMITKESAGGIIGKGGNSLKELQVEFGLKVYIERDVIDGTHRNVILSGGDASSRLLCQERIIAMSHDPLYQSITLSNNNSSSNNNNSDNNDDDADMSSDMY